MNRIKSIDIVRGIVMVIMALDHVRDLLHMDALTQSTTDMATTTPVLFFTRFIIHLCAPTFVFLTGTSVYISFKSKNNIAGARKHLLKREVLYKHCRWFGQYKATHNYWWLQYL